MPDQREVLLTYNITISTPGSPVTLASGIPGGAGITDGTIIELDVVAVDGNAGNIYIGYTGVNAPTKVGIPLQEFDDFYRDAQEKRYRVWEAKLSQLKVDAEQAGDKVSVVARVVVEA